MAQDRFRQSGKSAISVLAVIAAFAIGSCGDGSSRPNESNESTSEPTPKRLLQPLGEATLVAAGDLLVPSDHPAGLIAKLVRRDVPKGAAGEFAGGGNLARLYADSVGRRVLVIYQSGEEFGPAPLDGLEGEPNDVVNDLPAHVIEVDDGWWVRWYQDDGTQETPMAAMFAEGVDRRRALAIANEIRVDGEDATTRDIRIEDPDALELIDVARAPGLSIGHLGGPGGNSTATMITWAPEASDGLGEPWMSVSAWKQDPALSEILRAAVDGDITEVRGLPGVAGSLIRPGDDERLARTWDEDGTTLLVVSSGLAIDQLDAIVEGLSPATDDDWGDLTAQVIAGSQLDEPGLAGTFAEGSWTYTLEHLGSDVFSAEVMIRLADGSHDSLSGGTVSPPLWVDVTNTDKGALVAGITDAETVRIVLTHFDGTTSTAELHLLESGGGVKVFGDWYEHGDIASATTFDANGLERARGEHDGGPATGKGGYSFAGTLVG